MCSNDSNDIKNGFILYKGFIYVKTVKLSELAGIYSIKTYANYKGYKFEVVEEKNEKISIVTMGGDYKVWENMGMKCIDKGVYQKWINKNEAEVIIEKEEL